MNTNRSHPALLTLLCWLPLHACQAPCLRDPAPDHAIAEISLVIQPDADSRTAFDRLPATDQHRVVEAAWLQVAERIPRAAMAELGPHRIALDTDGYPSRVELDRLLGRFRGLGRFAVDPPKGCTWDSDGDPVRTLKCAWKLPGEIRVGLEQPLPEIKFLLEYEIHSRFLRPDSSAGMPGPGN
ncbi:MAG: hypothetical protein IPM29_23180 [Planctomycetes bacterium]|nr:hypothetical protein [Planctomycetota bacterium]